VQALARQPCVDTHIFRRDPPACLHCGLPVESTDGAFCCVGCEAVYGLLHEEHLDGYYALRGSRGVPVAERRPSRRDAKWIEPIEAGIRASDGSVRVALDVQGLHCVGCVWLIEALLSRTPGGEHVVINPALGRVDLVVRPTFDLAGFVSSVERFGYLFGPPIKRGPAASRDLVWRLGLCTAIAMNSMIFAIAIYAGLDRGPLYRLFTALNFGLGTLAVAIGGSVFFRSAWHAMRRGILHLDLPIAVGITLAFGGSAWLYLAHRAQATYFDTLDVFITLMLLGRWLQERAVERNRAWLLESDGSEGLLARRIRAGRVELVRSGELREGDRLLIAPGDLLPVDACLESGAGAFSLDWIIGESRPRSYEVGAVVPAGAFASGRQASVLRAQTSFAQSPLTELLRAPEPRSPDTARSTIWFQRLAKLYVVGVLAIAAAGFAAWWLATGDFPRALSITTAVLIVTCPCAFGIASPLAYEIVQARLRRAGLFVRRASMLDRTRDVRRVVFDKTGTLTTGALAIANPEALDALSAEERAVLYDLTARSGHPKSAAIMALLARQGASLREHVLPVEHPGLGVELEDCGRRWRLGEPAWVAEVAPEAARRPCDVAFGGGGRLLAALTTVEELRADAAREVSALRADGCEVWLLSGDAQARVDACARAVGIPPEHALGGRSPHDKANFLDAHDQGDTLFVGDGVNDALALDHAHVSGTPAVDRPYVPARADFFFVTAGLSPVRLAMRSARALAQVVRADLAIALAYNAVAITLALAGLMSPLLCAVLMPASSLTTIAATVAALSPGSRLWKS
jgi:Cu2+-exporting ATPase